MKNVSIITGATSGIGLEIAKLIARENTDILLISSNENNLKKTLGEIEKISENKVEYFVCDLINLQKEHIDYLTEYTKGYRLLYFVNNAGFGDYGTFHKTSATKQDNMIDLNIKSLTNLSRFYLKKAMDQEEKSYLLNVASVASYMPGPLMSVYYATKAYVLSFTRGIRYEYRKEKRINISTLCPGPTRTNFIKSSNLETSPLFSSLKTMSAKKVAEIGLRGLKKNKAEIIPGITNYIMVILTKFSPITLVTYITNKIMENKNGN